MCLLSVSAGNAGYAHERQPESDSGSKHPAVVALPSMKVYVHDCGKYSGRAVYAAVQVCDAAVGLLRYVVVTHLAVREMLSHPILPSGTRGGGNYEARQPRQQDCRACTVTYRDRSR